MGIDVNTLISAASRKLGIPEDKLRSAVNSGDTAELRSYLSKADNERLEKALKDRKLTDDIRNKYMAGK